MTILKTTIDNISDLDRESMQKAKKRQDLLIKPKESLGKLEEISIQLAGIYGQEFYDTNKKAIIAFAGDHGVY